jgi:asparagine synthase (glutamine-hydrolysing)
MCGICGLVRGDGTVVEIPRLERMARVIRHRGPDDAGAWTSGPGPTTAGLAHRRLSIIDLSAAGHQPMSNEDGTIWLTYNGEIYNHAALRRELEPAGHRYCSHTDSETIVHAYEEWGDDCVTRFRGMFAFALWDGPRERLLLVRDRLGIKPLYYAVVGRHLVFASEIKAILESGLIGARPAMSTLPEYLAFGYLAGEDTLFEGVRKLPPGHRLVWQDGRVVVEPFWTLRFAPDEEAREGALVERFRQLFEESVELRLMSDVPLGVFLSGGLDSSAIAAVMGRFVSGRIKTFSVGYEPQYYSEFPFAREVAALAGADHREIVLTADMFSDALPRLVWHEDEPLWGTASVALYFVSTLAARDVKVVLTGEGSDELFAGYDRYWMTALNARAMRAYALAPRALRAALRRVLVDGPLPERVRRALGHTILVHDTLPDGLFLDNWLGIFPPAWQRRIAGPALVPYLDAADVHASHRRFFESSGSADVIDRLLYTDIKTNLVELLMKQDQMSMATSIESRVPFLDHHLVELAATVPSRFKVKRFSGKRLVKDALAPYLPDRIRHRRKMGFPVPYERWLDERFAPEIEALLLDDRARAREWIRPDAIREIFTAHRGGHVNLSRQIWSLWGLELWARAFLDGERPAAGTPHDVRRAGAVPAAVQVG